MFERLAHITFTRPRTVLAVIGLLAVLSVAFGGKVADRLKPAGFTDPASESARADEAAAATLGYDPLAGLIVLATDPGGEIAGPASQAAVAAVVEQLRADPDVARVESPFDRGVSPALISDDGSRALIPVHFSETDNGFLEDAAGRIPGEISSDRLQLAVGGRAVSFNDVNHQVRDDLLKAELIAFPILAVLLMLVFRGLVAASLPLMIGGISVVGTFLGLRILSEFTEVSIFALNITTALGLGLAVDYGLLLTSRFREELQRSGPGWEAHRRTVETAGRAVFFSGLTVAAATASMIVLPQRFLYSMGAGATIVALLAASAALFATPALFALLGERVNALSFHRVPAPAEGTGRWYRLAEWVMRRPVRVAIVVTVTLLALASPVLRITLTQPGSDAVPRGATSRDVSELITSEFTPNLESPIGFTVAADQAGEVERRVSSLDGVLALSPPLQLPGREVFLQATPRDDPLSPQAQATTREIRSISSEVAGASQVSGPTAEFIDFKQSLVDHAPLVAGLIAGSTMLLLFGLTGSLILPLKTLLMNALSIGAAIGVVVIVFQDGFGAGLFAYDGPSAVETGLLVVVGATTFGLATDYAVLVLARIKEYHDQGLSNARSVALGIDRTGRVISAAAMLLAVVFVAFTTGKIFFMKEVGVGQAVAVAIDASIVRALLVPALMRLLGDWNWWAPGPLRRLHRRLGLGEPPPEQAPEPSRA